MTHAVRMLKAASKTSYQTAARAVLHTVAWFCPKIAGAYERSAGSTATGTKRQLPYYLRTALKDHSSLHGRGKPAE